jgi:hypothetical protein
MLVLSISMYGMCHDSRVLRSDVSLCLPTTTWPTSENYQSSTGIPLLSEYKKQAPGVFYG